MLLIYLSGALALVWLSCPAALRNRAPLPIATFLAAGFAFGQGIGDSRRTYPFIAWTLYSDVAPIRAYHEYMAAEPGNGLTFAYSFTDVAFSSPRAVAARLDSLVAACQCKSEDATVDLAIAALSAAHEQTTGHRLTLFQVWNVILDDVPGLRHHREVVYEWRK